MSRKTVYISIGNSDDKLTQFQWAAYVEDVQAMIRNLVYTQHGEWFSASGSKYQNACWCVEIRDVMVPNVRDALAGIAAAFNQDSIAWAEATTEFITPTAVS